MKTFIFDIETLAWFKSIEHKSIYQSIHKHKGLTDPKKKEENITKIMGDAALRPTSGQIIAIGMKEDGAAPIITIAKSGYTVPEDPMGTFPHVTVFENEKLLIDNFLRRIDNAVDEGARLVSFNGKAFDIPFVFIRSLLYGIPPTRIPYDDLVYPYGYSPHADMKSFFEKGGLNEICYMLDIAEFSDTNGSDIDKLWSKNPLLVAQKCAGDLERTQMLYDRVEAWIPFKMRYYK